MGFNNARSVIPPGLFDAALEIAERRRNITAQLKEALRRQEQSEINRLAEELCGVDHEEGNRTDSSVN